MKRAAALIVVLILAMLLALPASADLVLSAPESVDSGRRFTASLVLEKGADISAVHVNLKYSDPVKLVKVEFVQPGKMRWKENDSGAGIVLLSESSFEPGETALLTFSSRTAEDDITIDVEVVQSINEALEDVPLNGVGFTAAINGKTVSVKSTRVTSQKIRSSRVSSARSRASSGKASSKRSSSGRSSKSSGTKSDTAAQPAEERSGETAARIVGSEGSPLKYAAAGSAATVAAVLILFAVYRMGQLSRTPDRAEKENEEKK